MRIDFAFSLEEIAHVNAAAKQHLERAGKCMLVNGGGAIEPVVDVNVKPWPNVDGDRWIAKLSQRIHLFRQVRCLLRPANDLPRIYRGPHFRQRCGGYFRKRILAVILVAPASFNDGAKFGKRLHRQIIGRGFTRMNAD